MSIKLDAVLFQQRIKNLIKYWTRDSAAFSECEAILIPAGDASEDTVYQKGSALQTWLFLYEFPDTNLLITKEKVFVIASQKKCNMLSALNDVALAEKKIEIVSFVRSKEPEAAKEALAKFVAEVGRFKRIGIFPKDRMTGKWMDEWNAAYGDIKGSLDEVDASGGVSVVLAVKDEAEIKLLRQAGKMSSLVMKNYFLEEMASIIDEEKSITHEKFASKIENVVYDDKLKRKLNFPTDISGEFVDFCYTPIIQSGGNYDLKPSAVSSSDKLTSGTILCSLGIRYRNYCSNVGRSFLIDPTEDQEKTYNLLLKLQKHVMENMKDNAKLGEVYDSAISFLQENQPALIPNFVKNVGFVTGLEFRDSNFVINSKNSRELYNGMSVNLILGFQDLKNPKAEESKDKRYSLMLSDTVLVGAQGATYLTDAPREYRLISFFFKDDEDEAAKVPSPPKERFSKSAILKTKLRAESRTEADIGAELRRKQHQKDLLQQRIDGGLSRFSTGETGVSSAPKQVFRKFESYRKDTMIPAETKANRILIDKRNETVLFPIFGMAVPFHLNTIKNVSKTEEGDQVYLRFNFNTPAVVGKKEEVLPYEDPNATFIRTLSFKSADTARYNELYRQITEMKKELQKRELERRQKADIVEQDKLIESKRPIALLADVGMRPGFEGRKLPGDLQIHQNGLRYQPIRGDQKADVLFSNIKHLFFQPCDNELYVILHCHLKNPIIIGKKKTKDVQFFRDVSEGNFDDTSNRRNRRQHYNDEDELMAEQEERKRKQKMNKEFKSFAEKIAEVSGFLEADMPIRELGFSGVPARTNVLMQPTTECLVHLTDPPFSVITLSDVEIAYLERVQFHLRNFDLVFVMKDFSTAPIHINTIPMKQLEPIKEWLDSVDIPYIEGPFNLNWGNIMKNINQDPAGFYEDGGWANIAGDDEEGSEDEEESASEFEMSDESEEESEDDESDFDEEESESEEEEEEEDFEEDEESEEEERRPAKKSHVKRREYDDDIRPKKKRK